MNRIAMLLGVALLAAHSTPHATTISVTTNQLDATTGCTLRNAFAAAELNENIAGCPAGNDAGGSDTIDVSMPNAVFDLDSFVVNQQLSTVRYIASKIVLKGNGATIRLPNPSQCDGVRFFTVTGALTLEDTHLVGGCVPGSVGGAIRVDGGALTLQRSSIERANVLTGDGGAVAVTNGSLLLVDSLLSQNNAARGGAVVANNSTLTATNTRFMDNTASGFGGAVYAPSAGGASTSFTGVTAFGNQAQSGSFVRVDGGSTRLDRSLIVSTNTGTAIVQNNTNTAGTGLTMINTGVFVADAGGVYLVGGQHSLRFSTLVDNGSGSVISAANSPSLSVGAMLVDGVCSGNIAYNQVGPNIATSPCGPMQTADRTAVLGDFDGSRAMPRGIAVDATECGSHLMPVTVDLLNAARPADGDGDGVVLCDIGAFELQDTIFKGDFETP